MWYVFPQYRGLGMSEVSRLYAIQNVEEAGEYLRHPVLGSRLREIARGLLQLQEKDALKVFGSPDDLKLRSCMTLFSLLDHSEDPVFRQVLEQYFHGEPDPRTIELLQATSIHPFP